MLSTKTSCPGGAPDTWTAVPMNEMPKLAGCAQAGHASMHSVMIAPKTFLTVILPCAT